MSSSPSGRNADTARAAGTRMPRLIGRLGVYTAGYDGAAVSIDTLHSEAILAGRAEGTGVLRHTLPL